MKGLLRILVVLLCFVGFVMIRFRESELFYDPLITFFKGNYRNLPLPEMDQGKLMLHLFFRYILNTGLSLIVLWVAFREKGIITFASIFYSIVFVLLIIVLNVLFATQDIGEYLPVFYVRRFLIQPILLFILLPAFYYYRKVNS